jgi:hypothetical protein
MLTIKKEEEIRNLIDDPRGFPIRDISEKVGVSYPTINKIWNMLRDVDELGMPRALEIREYLLRGLAIETISLRMKVSCQKIVDVQRYYYLQPRRSGRRVGECPTCGSIMFDSVEKLKEKFARKPIKAVPKKLSRQQTDELYGLITELVELNRCCIITNPLFYHLAQRAEKILEDLK